jgi:hypothetical protein
MQATLKAMHWLILPILLGLLLSWLTGCDDSSLILGQPGQPTLVFIYTDT